MKEYYKALKSYHWCYPIYENLYEHEDWKFTGRVSYDTRYDYAARKEVSLSVEVREMTKTDISNPSYCKYFGDQRKTIKGYATQWIAEEYFKTTIDIPENTSTIYECQ